MLFEHDGYYVVLLCKPEWVKHANIGSEDRYSRLAIRLSPSSPEAEGGRTGTCKFTGYYKVDKLLRDLGEGAISELRRGALGPPSPSRTGEYRP